MKCLTTSCVYLADSHVGTLLYAWHIYVVVASRGNEWSTEYWLEHYLNEKQTLNVSIRDSEGNDFSIGSMVIKGEYLTHVSYAPKKKCSVFEDYRPGRTVCHYINLVIGTSL